MMYVWSVVLPGIGGSSSRVGLATNVGILILVAEVESKVVDDVSSVIDDIGSLLEVSSSSIAAEVLELGKVVGVGSGREAREDALLGEEERSSADGQNGALAGRVLLLKLGEVGDEASRLGLLLEDFGRVAAEDDEDVEFLESLVGLLEGDLGANDDALLRNDLGLSAGKGHLEGPGS
jgi:hypothetical protein